MAEFIIRGGKKLEGEIEVRGAKNSALKILPASLLFSGPLTVKNVPQIEDVFRMEELLKNLGAKVRRLGERGLEVKTDGVKSGNLKKELAERLRASVVLAGPLLARTRKVSFPHPGGDLIGRRPIDIFLEGWRAMGAKISANSGGYKINAKRLHGIDFTFRQVSVTGTETLMMTAALAKGRTVLQNAALEPEIPHLAEFLNKSGARIKGAGTPKIEIFGTGGKLLRAKLPFGVIPDRIDAGSFLILGAALGKEITIKKCVPEHLAVLCALLRAAGAKIKSGRSWLKVSRPAVLRSVDAKTQEYPGFATDLQAPFSVLMTQAQGQSLMHDTIFERRFGYIEELNRMGANIVQADPHRILIHGPTSLEGREIETPDIRAGLAFVIAALLAKGQSRLKNIYQIDRGYEKIEKSLQLLGADIKRVG